MDYEANRKELAHRLVEIEFVPVDREISLQDEAKTVSFPIGDIAEYGGAAASIMQALQGIAEASKTTGSCTNACSRMVQPVASWLRRTISVISAQL